jgi:hypothetical protein
VLVSAALASPATRLVDVYYPYLLPGNSSCARNNRSGYAHGATAAVNMLASAHDAVPAAVQALAPQAAAVVQVDLRDPASLFGSRPDPRTLLQRTAYYGYPHPNAEGQAAIASMALTALTAAQQ